MAIINFNAAQVEPQSSFEPIPADWYNVMIDESEMKPTKTGEGAYLECRLTVLDGKYTNRKLFIRLNLQNANETAVEIAYGQLSAICHATGVIQVADSQELHGKPFMAKVVVRPPKGEYEASNEVKAFKACGAGASTGAVAGAAEGATPAWVQGKTATPEVKKEPEVDPAIAAAAAKAKAAKKAELLRQLAEAEAEEDGIEDAVIVEEAAPDQAVVEDTPEQDNQPEAGATVKPPWMK